MNNFNATQIVSNISGKMLAEGASLLGNWVDSAYLKRVRSFIDEVPVQQSELNYNGTEKRVWNAQLADADVSMFGKWADEIISTYVGRRVSASTVLAYSNKPLDTLDGDTTGRWHIDSLRQQLKIFMFLTETTEMSGPFEWVVGTHLLSFKIRAVAAGNYLSLRDLGKSGQRKYSRLSDVWVDDNLRGDYDIRPLLCNAGDTFLVDTSSVHRARPCRAVGRYALTAYYRI